MLSRWLKKINTDTDRLKKAYALWKKEDGSVSGLLPSKKSALLQFEVDSGWSGFIDLEQWYCQSYPKLAALAMSHVSTEKLYDLFMENSAQLVLPELPIYEPLKFNAIVSTRWIKQFDYLFTQSYFSFETLKGRIWVTQLQEKHLSVPPLNSSSSPIIKTIPLFLKCILGQSQLSLRLFKQIKVGDILLIQKTQHALCIDRNIIGTYQIENEGIMIDLHHLDLNETIEEHYDVLPQQDTQKFYETVTEENEVLSTWLDRKKTIPITLSFILDQKKIKLGELESLTEGKRLPISPESYKSIEIEANGVAIAKGEIVIVDDTMAVEVTAIYGES